MNWTPIQRALSDKVTKVDFQSTYKRWNDGEINSEDFEKQFLEAYYPAKALENTGVTPFLVPSFNLLTRSENELKRINPDLPLHDTEFMEWTMKEAYAAAAQKPAQAVDGAGSALKRQTRRLAKERQVVVKAEPQSPPPLKRIKTQREGKGKASSTPQGEDVIDISSDSEYEKLLAFDWTQQQARPVVKGKYKHEAPPVGHRIVANNVTFVLQMRKCQRCGSNGFDCYLPDPTQGRSCFKCKATHASCVFKPLQCDELFRPSNAVMDLVGHFELPSCQLNRATASVEAFNSAIAVHARCIGAYNMAIATAEKVLQDRLIEEAGSSHGIM